MPIENVKSQDLKGENHSNKEVKVEQKIANTLIPKALMSKLLEDYGDEIIKRAASFYAKVDANNKIIEIKLVDQNGRILYFNDLSATSKFHSAVRKRKEPI